MSGNCLKEDEGTVSDYDTSQFYSGSEGEADTVSEMAVIRK